MAFSNATGGGLLLGVEQGQDSPPAGQQVPSNLPDTIRRKLAERTVKRALEVLIERGTVRIEGNNRWRRYWAIAGGRYAGAGPKNQSVLSTTNGAPWAIAAQPNLSHFRTHS